MIKPLPNGRQNPLLCKCVDATCVWKLLGFLKDLQVVKKFFVVLKIIYKVLGVA
jgi:hypothetical protein